jgi:hypothetical protein
MPSDLRLRLRRYSDSYVRGKVIDYSSMGVSMPTSDVFMLTGVQVSSRAYTGLTFPMLAGLEWSTGDPDQPVPGGLYFLSTDSYDSADTARVHQITGVQYIPMMLGGAKIWPSAVALDTAGGDNRRQLSGTPGKMIGDLVAEAQARGWFTDLVLDFTDTHDSNGDTWAVDVPSFDLTIGSSVWSLLSSLVKMFACEFTADFAAGVHTLSLWNSGHGTDLTSTVSIAPDADSIPVKQDYSNVATHIMGQLDDGSVIEHAVPGAPTTYGRIEAWVSLSGITDPTYAESILVSMEAGAVTPAKLLSISRQASGVLQLPLRDYLGGDIVKYRADSGTWLEGRVVQLTLQCDGPKVSVQETFGRIILDPEARLLGLVASATGGIAAGGSGVGIPSTPDAPNPAQPTSLVATPTGYWDTNGQPQGKVALTWAAVTTSDTGADMLMDRYEVLIRDTVLGSTDTYEAAAAFDNTLTLTTGFPVGSHWAAQVVAVGAGGGRSIPSTAATFTIPAPTIGVVAPVAPTVGPGLGMAIVKPVWLENTGGTPAMPAQVTNLRVYASPDGSTGWTFAGTAVTNGSDIKFIGIPGDTWWFACTAVTSDGQETSRGPSASLVIPGIDIPDLSTQVAQILTGPLIETNPGVTKGVKFSASGIVAYDNANSVTMLVDALTGLVYFRDGLIDGSVLASGTVQAAAIEAGTAFVDLIQSISDQLDLSANDSVQVVVGAAVDPLQSQVTGIATAIAPQQTYFTFNSNGFTSEPGSPRSSPTATWCRTGTRPSWSCRPSSSARARSATTCSPRTAPTARSSEP